MDRRPGLHALPSLLFVLVSLLSSCDGASPYCQLPFDISDDEASLIQVNGKVVRRGFEEALTGSRVANNTTERQGGATASIRPVVASKPQRQAEIASKVAQDASEQAARAGELAASASTALEAQAASEAAMAASQLVKGARRAAKALSLSSGFGEKPRPVAVKAGVVGLPHAVTSSQMAADAAAWLELSLWRKGANAIPVDVHHSGSFLSAVAVVMFALVIVAMALIFFRLGENREIQDTIAALENQKNKASEQHNEPLARKIQREIEDLEDKAMPSRARAAQRSTVVDIPQIHGAMVPPGRKFIVKIPPLLKPTSAHTQRYNVLTNNNMEMLLIQLFQHMPHSDREAGTDAVEGFTISVPAEGENTVVLCTFVSPVGQKVRCEIYETGSGNSVHFGSFQEDSQCPLDLSESGATAYTLFLAGSGRRLLSVVVRGNVKDRDIKIVDGMTMSDNTATTVRGDTGDAPYQVECYPRSDMILAVILLACVDRLSVLNTVTRSGGWNAW